MKKLFKCSVCGFIYEGDDAPEYCPKCKQPKEKFNELPEEDAAKVRRSDFSNDLHMKLIGLCMKIDKLADAGITDNLDPMCVAIFEKAKKYAWELKQSAKAEIAGHIGKGKW